MNALGHEVLFDFRGCNNKCNESVLKIEQLMLTMPTIDVRIQLIALQWRNIFTKLN